MGADRIARTADRLPMVPRRRPTAALNAESRRFWIGVACAAVFHAALILGVARSSSRYLGEPEGSSSGISVELVDEADLLSRSTVPSLAEQPPASAGSPAPPPPQPEAASAPAPEPQTATAVPIEREKPSSLAVPAPAAKERETSPPAKPKPKSSLQQSPSLRLDLPDAMIGPSGRSASVMRPPGVTRSGRTTSSGAG